MTVKFNYREGEILDELREYIEGTYGEHYADPAKNLQTIDVYDMLGSLDTTCRDTAIKYLMRYGKKGGHNKKDLLKAMHYIILLWYATQEETGLPSTGTDEVIEFDRGEYDMDKMVDRYPHRFKPGCS